MKSLLYLTLIMLIFGCKSTQIGVGASYDVGNSRGYPGESGVGFVIESAWYPKRIFLPGLGIGWELDIAGNDLIIFSMPQISYRKSINEYSYWHVNLGYIIEGFGDNGLKLSGGLYHYFEDVMFINLNSNYYRAFSSPENSLKPGISSNFSTQLSFGFVW